MVKLIPVRASGVAAVLSALSVASYGASPVVADFAAGEAPEGWTLENGEYRSPDYPGAVDRIELRYSGADVAASSVVRAFTEKGDGTAVATISAASSGASFDFPETTDFRSFRIAPADGFALSSFAAYVSASELDAPSGVAISNNITGTSFDAAWDAVDGATGYRVYVWTNVVAGASAGTEAWKETLPWATNGVSITKLNDTKFSACFENAGWTRSEKAGYPTGEKGTIRIGTSEAEGWIQTPQIPCAADGIAVRFFAKAKESNTKSMDVAVERVSAGDVVAFAGNATLTDEMQEFTIRLAGWESGNCIRINSLTNGDRRVIIGAVTVVSGYSEGRNEPSYIVNGLDIGNALSHSFAALPSVPVQFAVEAYGRRGVSSAKTEAVEVDLANPDKVAVLNACTLSSLASESYTQDFDSLAEITKPTGDKEWLNGTTLPYWQAYKDADAVTSFNYNGGSGTIGGLYVFAADRDDPGRGLGAYSTQNDEFSFGIAFTNDTGNAMKLSSLSYLAQQWGFKNDTKQTMSVSVKVVDGLDWISAHTDGWTELTRTESVVYADGAIPVAPVSTSVEIDPAYGIPVAPGQVLLLKWTVHSLKSGKPGMMGIDDVEVGFGPGPETGFHIHIAADRTVR